MLRRGVIAAQHIEKHRGEAHEAARTAAVELIGEQDETITMPEQADLVVRLHQQPTSLLLPPCCSPPRPLPAAEFHVTMPSPSVLIVLPPSLSMTC